MANEKKKGGFKEYLLKESAILEKEEDTNPLYYMWAVLKSVNGKTEEEIKHSDSLKALFKKIDKFCDKYKKETKALKSKYTPSEFLCGFKDMPVDKQKECIDWRLEGFIQTMTYGIQSFNEWRTIRDDWNELVKSEEMQTVIAEI